jgi:hypothetical protein
MVFNHHRTDRARAQVISEPTFGRFVVQYRKRRPPVKAAQSVPRDGVGGPGIEMSGILAREARMRFGSPCFERRSAVLFSALYVADRSGACGLAHRRVGAAPGDEVRQPAVAKAARRIQGRSRDTQSRCIFAIAVQAGHDQRVVEWPDAPYW